MQKKFRFKFALTSLISGNKVDLTNIMKQGILMKYFVIMLMSTALMVLSGCSTRSDIGEPRENIQAAEEVFEIGVNAYLWRATLDTLSFMPILSADHNSGTILSDWQTNPNNANERTKVDVYIIGKQLRADALKVTVHREELQNGNWVSVNPRPNASTQIINAIIIQARLLRRDNAPLTN